MPQQAWYEIVCLAFTMAFVALGVKAGTSGWWWFALLPIIISPLSMALLRKLGEPKMTVAQMFNPATQSWAFLFGDAIFLPIAFFGAALSWRTLRGSWFAYFNSLWWIGVAALAGFVAQYVFHNVLNAPTYERLGLASLLESPTSVWHDRVVYFTLVMLFVMICVPAAIHDIHGWGGKLVIIGLVGWLAMVACDATFHQLDPRNLHPPVEETILAP